MTTLFSVADGLALVWFILLWLGYGWIVDHEVHGRDSLTARMSLYRRRWMDEMLQRSNRIVDGQINLSLQQGTAFFASTALIAVGGGLTLLGATEKAVDIVEALPFGQRTPRAAFEVKVVGLIIIAVYAFFKFSWAYRLFNYCAILIGAAPDGGKAESPEARAMADRAAAMNIAAARHFNRGQRAFFFALGYLGWFLGPFVFAAATTAVVIVVYRRQFASDSHSALG